MRLEVNIELEKLKVPRFSVEAVEGIGKLFTLATLVLNVLDSHERVEIVFHGLNPEDPERKIEGFKTIMSSCETVAPAVYQISEPGRVPGSSSYFQWLNVLRS